MKLKRRSNRWKKVVSLLLAGVLTVTGADVDINTAKAAEIKGEEALTEVLVETPVVPTATTVVTASRPATEAPTERPMETEVPSEAPTERPTPSLTPYQYPKDVKEGFRVGLTYVSDDWTEGTPWKVEEMEDDCITEIEGDGEYAVSYTALTDVEDIGFLILVTDVRNNAFGDDFNIMATNLTVARKTYPLNTEEGNLMFTDGDVEEGCLRYNVRNPYNYKCYRDKIKDEYDEALILDEYGDKIACDNLLDPNGDSRIVPVKAGDTVTVYFEVTGTGASLPFRTLKPFETPTPTPYQYPTDVKNGFQVGLTYVGNGWAETTPFDITGIESDRITDVKGDGEYAVSYTAQMDTDNILFVILTTNVRNNTFGDDFNITATSLTVGRNTYPLNTEEGNLMFTDGDVEDGCLRYNIRNPYNYKIYRNRITLGDEEDACILDRHGNKIWCENILDFRGDPVEIPVIAGNKITVKFTVSGVNDVKPTGTPQATERPSDTPRETGTPGTVVSRTPTPPAIRPPQPTSPVGSWLPQPTSPVGSWLPQQTASGGSRQPQPVVNTPKPTPVRDEDDDLSDEIEEFEEGVRAKIGNAVYRVTDASKQEVEYQGVTKNNAVRLTVPNTVTVTVDGKAVRCKVTGVGKNAFKGSKKLKVVVLGANVRKIGKGAFAGCKSLRKIIIKSKKLNKVANNAFQGISGQCKIVVPGSKWILYKKMFQKKGLSKSVQVVQA